MTKSNYAPPPDSDIAQESNGIRQEIKFYRMLLPAAPDGARDWIWDDVVAMETLNSGQFRRGEENHVCPLPFDIVERLIERFTNPGELVLDPFGGLGTVPYIAVKMGRRGAAVELNPVYWKAACQYLREAEIKASAPTLFDLMAEQQMAAD